MFKNTSTHAKVKSHRGGQGQAIVIVALMMVGLLAFMVLAIDGSKYYDQRRITQNAGDVSALAGLHAWYSETGANNNKAVLAKVLHTAEINGIPDTDGTKSTGFVTGNLINENVAAYWVNVSGDYVTSPNIVGCSAGTVARTTEPAPDCAKIDSSSSYGMPTGSATAANNGSGVRVRVKFPYTTFVGQMVGSKNLQAQADSIALHTAIPVTIPPAQAKQAVWAGGGADCMTGSSPALAIGTGGHNSAQNTDISNAMVNGGLAGGDTNDVNKQYQGTITTVGTTTGSPATSNPLQVYNSPSNQFLQGSAYAPTRQFNDWAYLTDEAQSGVVNVLKQAILFKPDSRSSTVDIPTTAMGAPAGASAVPTANDVTLPNNYAFRQWYLHRVTDPTNTPDNFYHYVSYSSTANNYIGLRAMLDAGKKGVFYVDGDLVITNHDTGTTTYTGYDTLSHYGVTIIVSGKLTIDGANNESYGNAGKWGHGISFLAGGYPDTAAGESPCAVDKDDAILLFNAQQNDWNGIIFVPNGLAAIGGNFNNSGITHGVLMAYSVGIGMEGHPAQNAAFSGCSDCWIQPDTNTLNLTQ